ncbi:hypothetical protein U9M48_005145 [Paspalum notatum var. saurae]|uniref:Transposase n=1 Tax=Paspalum notatum var. saurae TaxID=547442 RepID=A0AAQ3SLQ1_PASNO
MDEEEGHTINDDLRMMGMAGDNEEDLEQCSVEVLGATQDSPVVLAADDAEDGAANGGKDGATGTDSQTKRVIGFRLIDVSHSGDNIAERIYAVLSEFGLTDKTFSITFDNACANANAMQTLKPLLSGYVGELFLHQRCACHIVNLMVQCALTVVDPFIDAFRKAISCINSSNQRIALYKSFCIAMGVRPRKFGLDMSVKWNSTYLMLKHLLLHRESFDMFIQTHYPKGKGQNPPPLLTPDHWYVAQVVLSFLELSYDSTCVLSGVYYPTSPIVMHHVVQIANHFHQSNFSLTGNILEDRRRRLTAAMVEKLTCIKDWEEGDARAQHSVEDKELEDAFAELYLDEEATAEAGAEAGATAGGEADTAVAMIVV